MIQISKVNGLLLMEHFYLGTHSALCSMPHSPLHTRTFTLCWTHREQLGIHYFAQRYFSMQTGAAQDRTTSAPPPEPQLPTKMEAFHLLVRSSCMFTQCSPVNNQKQIKHPGSQRSSCCAVTDTLYQTHFHHTDAWLKTEFIFRLWP